MSVHDTVEVKVHQKPDGKVKLELSPIIELLKAVLTPRDNITQVSLALKLNEGKIIMAIIEPNKINQIVNRNFKCYKSYDDALKHGIEMIYFSRNNYVT